MMAMKKALKQPPCCYIIAGPNGSGKTTFATEFLPHQVRCLEFVNPDLIAKGLSPFSPERAAARAGRLVLERIRELSAVGSDFAMETTLSGLSYQPLLRRLKERGGYELHMFFLWLPTLELSLDRIADRVRDGGHDVPEADVRRRFPRVVRNLFGRYLPLLATLYFYDNSAAVPKLVFVERNGQRTISNPKIYQHVLLEAAHDQA